MDFNPDVVMCCRLIGYENRGVADQDFRNGSVDAGEIGAGHFATAINAVQFRPEAVGRFATIQLRWEDPDDQTVREINGVFLLTTGTCALRKVVYRSQVCAGFSCDNDSSKMKATLRK